MKGNCVGTFCGQKELNRIDGIWPKAGRNEEKGFLRLLRGKQLENGNSEGKPKNSSKRGNEVRNNHVEGNRFKGGIG